MDNSIGKLFVFVICGLLILVLFLPSCSFANKKDDNKKIISEISSKYYNIDGKYNEINFIVTSSFFDELVNKLPTERMKNYENLKFYAKLKKGGELSQGVGNVPSKLSASEKKEMNAVIATMKKQINSLFVTIGYVISDIINTQYYSVEVVENKNNSVVILQKLKDSNLQDKLFFDGDLIIKKSEAYANNKLSSIGTFDLKKGPNQIYITSIKLETLHPERQISIFKIKYKEYKGINLPYTIENQTHSRGEVLNSNFTLKPIQLE